MPVAKKEDNVADTLKKEMDGVFATVDKVNIDSITLNGLSVRAGGKLLKLQVVETSELEVVEEIKNEYRAKLNDQLGRIKTAVQSKVSEMVTFVSTIREDYEKKELELKKRLEKAQIMPALTMEHMRKGLSVGPGDRKDELYFFFRAVYWPKFVDMVPIEPRYAKKLVTPIIIQIVTEGSAVKSVHTKTPIGLKNFSHYHQADPDCWGRWKWKTTWKTPDDIIAIAKEAEGVLENVNTASVAKRNPIGLPTEMVLKRHVTKKGDKPLKEADTNIKRTGVTATGTVASVLEDDSWST
jgi:hypothetical protein